MFTLYFICRENELEKIFCSTFDDDAARDIFILRYADDDVLSLLLFFSTAATAALSSATTRVVERLRLFFFRVEKKSFDEECDEFSSRNDQKSIRRNTLCAIETTTERLIGFSDEKRRESRR